MTFEMNDIHTFDCVPGLPFSRYDRSQFCTVMLMSSETTSSPETLCLIDGSSYLYRAFHALPSLTSADGAPTGAIFGVANMIRRLIETHRPERIAVIFDAPGKTFRHELFEDYKANRAKMPDELRSQIGRVRQVVEALSVPVLEQDGFEATRSIHANLGRRESPIIVAMTAHALRGDRERCLAAGMDDYLSKPVQIEQLKQVIERVVALRRDPVMPSSTGGSAVSTG